jgi:hypothetical protein
VVQARSADLALLDDLLRQLVDQPLLFLSSSSNGTLTVHLGLEVEKSPRRRRRQRRGQRRGSYILAARPSRWQVRLGGPAVHAEVDRNGFRPLTEQDVKEGALVQPGEPVVQARTLHMPPRGRGVPALELLLSFSGGTSFRLTPRSGESGSGALPWAEDVADWEVHTPHGRWLRVGPGAEWAYLPIG